MACRRIMLLVTLLACLSTAGTTAAQTPRLLGIEAARVGDDLGCLLHTAGLPGDKMLSSMRSGLVSSVELNIELLDGADQVLTRRRLVWLLSFDLWDESYSVRIRERSQVFGELTALRDWMTSPPAMPLLPVRMLDEAREPFVLRAVFTFHPIAPRDRHRVENVIAGDDRNEATVSVGSLIRLFYADQSSHADPAGSVRSRPFRPEDLPHAVDSR